MLNVTFRKNQVEKLIELLEVELETMVEVVKDGVDTLDSMFNGIKCNVETLISLGYEPTEKHIIEGYRMVGLWDEPEELDNDIIGYSVKHFHDILTNSDQEVIDEHCSRIDCSEGELFDRIHVIANRFDVQLDDSEE